VAHLVGMAFAVAASSNLPAILLTLYWRKCNTSGVVAGMLIGAGSAIALVLISPNMTYPQKVLAEANTVLHGAPAKAATPAKTSEGWVCELFTFCQHQETAKPAVVAIPARVLGIDTKTDAQIFKAQEDLAKYTGQKTSLVGLEQPLFRLKNPGILSIPLGFLAVILFSLLTRDRRAERLWEELYVRQNTGLHAADASH
jgi:cation/acetate symporter